MSHEAKGCAEFLRLYNEWRRGSDTLQMPSPEEIGRAIDKAIELLRDRDELLHLLATALPFIEDAEGDDCYKPGVAKKLATQIQAAVKGGV
jgi:hypothetical protein